MNTRVIDESERIIRAERAKRAAGIKPALSGTGYSSSAERDNREAPTCRCGAPVYRAGLCVRCDEDLAETENRALAPEEQRD